MTAANPLLPRWAALMLALAAAPAAAAPQPQAQPPGGLAPCVEPGEQLFLSPMGEPFRAARGQPAPVGAWFAAADADRDGRLTPAEMVADADRFFTRLDADGDGELAPEEIAAYENRVAPEIRLYQSGWSGRGPVGRGRERNEDRRELARKNPKGGDVYDGAMGAGRYSWLNIPEPVAAADADFNRGVSRAEFGSAAQARFRLLDKDQAKVLTLATLPPLPERRPVCPPPEGRRRRR